MITHNDIHDLKGSCHLLLVTWCECLPCRGWGSLVGLLLRLWSGLDLGDPTGSLDDSVEGVIDHVRLLTCQQRKEQ